MEKKQSKKELRRAIATLEKRWTPETLRAADEAIVRRVLALPEWAEARCVFAYVSVRSEPDTHALIRAALDSGKRIAAPRCLGGGVMEARELRSLEALAPAGYGLLEPTEAAAPVRPEELDLAIIPCVAAGRDGYRLGHGAGYYDRYLPLTRAARVCLCRGEALLDAVPRDEFDARMDWIITEGESLRFRPADS